MTQTRLAATRPRTAVNPVLPGRVDLSGGEPHSRVGFLSTEDALLTQRDMYKIYFNEIIAPYVL